MKWRCAGDWQNRRSDRTTGRRHLRPSEIGRSVASVSAVGATKVYCCGDVGLRGCGATSVRATIVANADQVPVVVVDKVAADA